MALAGARRDLLDEIRGRVDVLGLAVERHDVAPQGQLRVELLAQRLEHRVVGARERRGGLVAQLDLAPHVSSSFAFADTRRPSACPPVLAIAAFITAPISFGDVAPVSSIAARTAASSSSSPISAGR